MNLVTVIIISVLVAVIIITAIILVKTIAMPKKVGNIQRLIKDGKFSLAEKTAKSLIAKNDRDFVSHYWLGKTYLAEKKMELAYAEFKIVNENALFNGDIPEKEFRKDMAELYAKFNDTQSALKEYLLLTKLDPQNAENCYKAGHIYEITGDLNMAKGFYQKAVTIDKRYSKAYTALGAMLFRGKKFAEAKKEFETALKINPNAVSNYYYLGKILKENKDYGGLITDKVSDFYLSADSEGNAILLDVMFEDGGYKYHAADTVICRNSDVLTLRPQKLFKLKESTTTP